MADTKKTKTESPTTAPAERDEPRWYLSGFALTERGVSALVGGLQDIRSTLVQTLSQTIDFLDENGQRSARLAHRLLDRADDFANAALGTAESTSRALLTRASRTSGEAAELAARTAGDLAA